MPSVHRPSPRLSERPDLARRRALAATLAGAAALAACTDRQPLADAEYTLLDGTRESLVGMRGRVLLVNFWATTCGVCIAEMPGFVALHQRRAAQGLVTRAVAMPYDPPARVAVFAEQRALPFGVVIDLGGAVVRAAGGVQATPTTLLVGRDGRVRQRIVGRPDFAALDAEVARALGAAA
jgi:thiol-disulfide isomerase/thioredoxin